MAASNERHHQHQSEPMGPAMKLAVSVHPHGEGAWAAAVAFDEWGAPEPIRTYTSHIALVQKPARGELDLRDLPCILQLLREHKLEPDTIVFDGAVHLDTADTPGLGRHLYDALDARTAIIGVASKSMPALPAQFEVDREDEARPVVVTCVGVDIGAAKVRVRSMHGRKRVPTLLKLAARLARAGAG
jgi:deoxyribonuclease V